MEPEVSLLHSQQPATCPYPEPDRSTTCPHPTFQKSILILSSHIRLGFPSDHLTSGFPPKKTCMHLSSPHTCYIPCPPSSLDLLTGMMCSYTKDIKDLKEYVLCDRGLRMRTYSFTISDLVCVCVSPLGKR
jgi:hypothetical protein